LTLTEVMQLVSHFGGHPVVTDCRGFKDDNNRGIYISVLASIIESGFPALLAFDTQHEAQHVVAVCGYTRNTDEWHPEALPAYMRHGNNKYYSSSAWIDRFVIHDDNFGPYYNLNCRVLEIDPKIVARSIVGIYPIPVVTPPSTFYLSSSGASQCGITQVSLDCHSSIYMVAHAHHEW
jgi:hypothetical protein